MLEYDVDNVSLKKIDKLEKYVSMTSFDPQSVEKNSRAAAPLADWVILIILYNTRLRERRASQKV